MDLFLAITQGIGSSLAAGVRAAAAALVVGLLAVANLGVDFGGTDFSFLESAWWLVAMGLLLVASLVAARVGIAVPVVVAGAVAVAVGALLFAGSLADDGYTAGPGLIAGAVCALVAFVAGTAFLAGAQGRLRSRGEDEAASFLELSAEAAATMLGAIAVVVPPVSLLALGAVAWALLGQRRRSARKYEGLRILR